MVSCSCNWSGKTTPNFSDVMVGYSGCRTVTLSLGAIHACWIVAQFSV